MRANPICEAAQGAASKPSGNRKLERRSGERALIRVRAIVNSGSLSQQTVLRDISNGGVGLEGADGLFPGCEVTIILLSGEQRSGVVRWWLAGRCGVQFHQPLGSEDEFCDAVMRRFSTRAAKF